MWAANSRAGGQAGAGSSARSSRLHSGTECSTSYVAAQQAHGGSHTHRRALSVIVPKSLPKRVDPQGPPSPHGGGGRRPVASARAVLSHPASCTDGDAPSLELELPVVIPDAVPSDLHELHLRASWQRRAAAAAAKRGGGPPPVAQQQQRELLLLQQHQLGDAAAFASGVAQRSAASTSTLGVDQRQLAGAGMWPNVSGREGRPGGWASARTMHVTMSIKAVKDWRQLPALVERLGPGGLDCFNVAALLAHVAQLASADPPRPEDLQLLQRLQDTALAAAPPHVAARHWRPRQLANVTWALAKLGLPSGAAYIQSSLMPASYAWLPWYEPQHLSNAVWALAVAGVAPEDAWWEEYLTVAYVVLERRGFAPQHLANVLWALERQGIMPDKEWLACYFDCVTAAVPALNSQDISNILLTLANMGLHTQEPDATRALAHRLTARLGQLLQAAQQLGAGAGGAAGGATTAAISDQSLANSMWAMATMSLPPTRQFVEPLLQAVEARLLLARPDRSGFDPVSLTSVLWSANVLQLPLPASLMAGVYSPAHEALLAGPAPTEPRALAGMLWAVATAPPTQARPPASWVDACCAAVAAQLPAMGAQSISNSVYALCLLEARPPVPWMAAVLNHFHRQLADEASPQAISNVLWCLAKMGFRMDDDSMRIMLGLVGGRLAAWHQQQQQQTDSAAVAAAPFSSLELSNILYALATFAYQPDPQLAALLLAAVRSQLPAANAQELSNVAWSCATLRLPLDDGWVADYFAASTSRLATYAAKDVAQTLYSLARLRVELAPGWLPACLQQATRVMPAASTQDLSNMSWALLQLGTRPPAGIAQLFAARLVATAEHGEPQHLALGIWALGKWRWRPSKRQLGVLEQATFKKMPAMRPSELAAMLSGFAGMRHVPDPDWLEDCVGHIALRNKEFGPQDWTVVLHALAVVKDSDAKGGGSAELPLRDEFGVSDYAARLLPRLQKLSPSALASLAYSCGCIGPQETMRRIVTRCMALLADAAAPAEEDGSEAAPSAAGSAAAATVASGVLPRPVRRQRPQPQQRGVASPVPEADAAPASSRAALPLPLSAVELSAALWGAVRVKATPPRAFQQAVMAHMTAQGAALPPSVLASCLWALGRLRIRGSSQWRRATGRLVERALPLLTKDKELAMCLWGMAWHRIIPSPRLYRVAAQAIVAAAPQLSTYMRRKACYSLACLDNRRLNRMAWARKAPQPRPASKQHQAAGRQAVPLAAAADTQQAAPAQAPGRSRPKRQEPAGVVAC